LKLFIEAQAWTRVPSTLKCSVDKSRPWLRQDCGQEPAGDSAFQQPVPVLREGRMIPGRVVDPEPDEPAEQQIELQTLHQLPLGPDRIERLQ
jgi:hypothetical protein